MVYAWIEKCAGLAILTTCHPCYHSCQICILNQTFPTWDTWRTYCGYAKIISIMAAITKKCSNENILTKLFFVFNCKASLVCKLNMLLLKWGKISTRSSSSNWLIKICCPLPPLSRHIIWIFICFLPFSPKMSLIIAQFYFPTTFFIIIIPFNYINCKTLHLLKKILYQIIDFLKEFLTYLSDIESIIHSNWKEKELFFFISRAHSI